MKLLLNAIQAIANKNNYSFVFADEAQSNLTTDFVKLPCVHIYALRFSDNVISTNLFGTKSRTYTFRLEVLLQSRLDLTDAERINLFSQADEMLSLIIHALRHIRTSEGEHIIREYSNISGTFVKNKYDANLDGVTCEISLTLPETQEFECPDIEINS